MRDYTVSGQAVSTHASVHPGRYRRSRHRRADNCVSLTHLPGSFYTVSELPGPGATQLGLPFVGGLPRAKGTQSQALMGPASLPAAAPRRQARLVLPHSIAQVPRPVLSVPIERYRERPPHWAHHGPPSWAQERERHENRGHEHDRGRG